LLYKRGGRFFGILLRKGRPLFWKLNPFETEVAAFLGSFCERAGRFFGN
jgi:hypothetical protein